MVGSSEVLEALPVAVYMTDADGRITFYNDAAAELWGCRPELGSSRWCGSWRLFWADGRPMSHDESPMAVAIREGVAVRGSTAIAERPDGSRVPFIPYPTPLKDESGRVIGAVNLLVDASERRQGHIDSARLASIVEGSDDAIISKTLDGRITSWNAGASRIFGYQPEEMIGQSILRIIPPELEGEERELIAKLSRGERIEHFDTVRVAKDGRRVNISLTVSPLRDVSGIIVGASKVARDITERKQAEQLQALLLEELNHRVKNTLATIQAIASQSLRRSPNPREFVCSFNGRVQALARAHDLLVQGKMKGAPISEILREQVLLDGSTDLRITCTGPFLMLDARAAVQFALVVHELATNARKYGGLSIPNGSLSINWNLKTHAGRELFLQWKETGVPDLSAPTTHGFGSTLIERTLGGNGGEASTRYDADGITCEIRFPLPDTDHQAVGPVIPSRTDSKPTLLRPDPARLELRGTRILLIEDEPLVGMEIASELAGAGCEVIGPAGSLKTARRLIGENEFDIALVDANLAGEPVDDIAAMLTNRGIPFAFATGYGRQALPRGFQENPVLVKPYNRSQLLLVVENLVQVAGKRSADVVPLTLRQGSKLN